MRSDDGGPDAEWPVLENAAARLLAGRLPELNLTESQSEALADWIGCVWHVAPIAVPLLLETNGHQLRPETRYRLEAIAAAASIQGKLFRQVAVEVAQAFADKSIDLVALKGTASGFAAYDDPAQRTGADLDFCVRPEALDDAKSVMRAVGFWPGDYDPETETFFPTDGADRSAHESYHYALGFWVKMLDLGEVSPLAADGFRVAGDLLPFASEVTGLRVKTPVLIDIHHSIGAGIPANDILDRPAPHDWNGTRFLLPPREWMAFHALLKLYWEGGQSYRKGFQYFADFARIVPRMDEEEIDGFAGLVEGNNLRPGGYYVLRRIETCLGHEFPEPFGDLLDLWSVLRPGETPSSSNDIGDFWPRMFGRR
jgi:hypothetical protein